ncbi:MAG: PTS sugar transporter subunit IIA [Elusimicrobiales bacterium]|nr:PTS sugar transporter subunit IIA [Elusimicrobiales bacterium]HOJ86534.1 PTS sugar transporter subunit IIA [Elusimicrobiales bacterium]HOL62499.1 PTS sugar transporter subunit IIA [Elusimicrobiales bacterium]HPO96034.1 PTS sugar transporter subunit IIA [Elusimicrobiales bacterium]
MTGQKAFSLSSVLSCENIIIKKEGFKDLKSLIDFGISFLYPSISDSVTINALKEKMEKSPSFYTVFDNGLFIPHLKFESLNDFKSVLIITPKPVKDNNIKYDIFLTFMLFSPLSKSFFEKHLNILSSVTKAFRDSVPQIVLMKEPSEVCSYIKSLK